MGRTTETEVVTCEEVPDVEVPPLSGVLVEYRGL